MKKVYITIFKQCFRSYLLQTRNELGLTQAQMSEKLNISERAYANLESGRSCCSTITFVLFLLLCTDINNDFLENLRNSFNEIYERIPWSLSLKKIRLDIVYRTPMFVVETRVLPNQEVFPLCPHCHSLIEREYMKFCDCCGQALNWKGYNHSKIVK